MPECLVILAVVRVAEPPFRALRLVLLIEAGTDLIVDALMCPYCIGERVRAKKLLRSVTEGMLLIWDRGLHSFAIVNATRLQGAHYLGGVPAYARSSLRSNVKFEVEQVLEDGDYLSLIYPDARSKKKGCAQIELRVIEYTIEQLDQSQGQQVYRLITSLMNVEQFPALLLAAEYHQRARSGKHD